MTTPLELDLSRDKIRELMKPSPDGNAAALTAELEALLAGTPRKETVDASKILVPLKMCLKKTKNSTLKKKIQELIQFYDSLGNGESKSKSQRTDVTEKFKQYRDKARERFVLVLENEDGSNGMKIGNAIEDALYEVYSNDENGYWSKFQKLISKISDKNLNKQLDLTGKLISGAITPDEFVKMNDKDFMSADDLKARAELEAEALKDLVVAAPKMVASHIFECPKCHKNETYFYQLQTRGGDEPMTNFVHCIPCNIDFKR